MSKAKCDPWDQKVWAAFSKDGKCRAISLRGKPSTERLRGGPKRPPKIETMTVRRVTLREAKAAAEKGFKRSFDLLAMSIERQSRVPV